MATSTPQEPPDEARLTQYGERSPSGDGFRDRLRPEIGETEMSMILGEVVIHSPTRGNPLHVSVYAPLETEENARGRRRR